MSTGDNLFLIALCVLTVIVIAVIILAILRQNYTYIVSMLTGAIGSLITIAIINKNKKDKDE